MKRAATAGRGRRKGTHMRSLCFCCILVMAACQTPEGDSPYEMKVSIREMHDSTLAELYKNEPSAKKEVEGAVGYAVFSNFGMKIFVFGSGNGYGVLKNAKKGTETFMRMTELNTGLGLGAKKFRAVFVFTDEETMKEVIG